MSAIARIRVLMCLLLLSTIITCKAFSMEAQKRKLGGCIKVGEYTYSVCYV